MDDIGAQLNKILSDPQSMSQIQNIMSGLNMNNQSTQTNNTTNNDTSSNLGNILSAVTHQTQNTTSNSQEQNGQPQQGLGIDPNMIGTIAKLAPLLNSVKADDESSRLLSALKPLLSEDKSKKIDDALKVLQIMKLLPMLKESGVLSSVLGNLF